MNRFLKLCCFASLVGLSSFSFAQGVDNNPYNVNNYQVVCHKSGQNSGANLTLQNGSVVSTPFSYAWGSHGLTYPTSTNYTSLSESISFSSVGTFYWTVVWIGKDASAAPDHVYLNITSTATAYGQPSCDGAVDDGLGDTKVQSGPYWNSAGTACWQVALSGGVGITPILTTSATASYSGVGGGVSAQDQASAVLAPYAVAVNCTLDPTYHKDPATGLRVLNTAYPQISPVYGDTAVYVDTTDYFPPFDTYSTTNQFGCELLGNWVLPSHTWYAPSSPNYWADDSFDTYETIRPTWYYTSDQLAALANGTPDIKKVTLNLVDHNGSGPANATGVYIMRLHNQYENWRKAPSMDPVFQAPDNFTVAKPGYATYAGHGLDPDNPSDGYDDGDGDSGVNCTWSWQGAKWSEMRPVLQTLVAITKDAFSNPIYKMGFTLAGFLLTDLDEKDDGNVCNWSWGDLPYNSIDGGNWDVDPSFYVMVPSMQCGYDIFPQTADAYDYHGFLGVGGDRKTKRNGSVHWNRHYMLSPIAGSGGY